MRLKSLKKIKENYYFKRFCIIKPKLLQNGSFFSKNYCLKVAFLVEKLFCFYLIPIFKYVIFKYRPFLHDNVKDIQILRKTTTPREFIWSGKRHLKITKQWKLKHFCHVIQKSLQISHTKKVTNDTSRKGYHSEKHSKSVTDCENNIIITRSYIPESAVLLHQNQYWCPALQLMRSYCVTAFHDHCSNDRISIFLRTYWVGKWLDCFGSLVTVSGCVMSGSFGGWLLYEGCSDVYRI